MRKLIPVVLLMVATAVVAGFVVYQLKPSAETRVSVTVEKIRRIAHLATVEYTLSGFARQVFTSSTGLSDIGIGERKRSDYVISYCTGKITGRVDLEKATIDVQEGGDIPRVSIHLEPGSIVISDVEVRPEDIETISVRDELSGCFFYKPATNSQRNGVQRTALKEMKQSALKSGIVDKTKENARTFLSDFLGSLGYQATITFDENAYDPSASS